MEFVIYLVVILRIVFFKIWKFGTDLSVYKKILDFEHSPFIVHVLPLDAKISAIDMVRAVRLAISVKKKFVTTNLLTNTYYFFERFKS